MLRKSVFTVIALLSSLALLAQDKPQTQKQAPFSIKVDTLEVDLPISILDREGRPIDGLKQENFQVFEDKIQQTIKTFKHEDIPLSLGLVIDNSGSMRNKRERVNSSALAFVRESNPDDETFIINFDDSAYLEQDFTGSIGDLIDALENIDTRGETALYDAIYLAAEHEKQGKKDKKALLVITDGEDNVSKYNLNKTLEELRKSKVTLYAIGLLEEDDTRGGLFHKAPSKRAKEELTKFAEVTGGQAYFPKTLSEVEDIVKRIAHDLRNHYTITYTPTNDKLDGTWREISVKITPPKNTPKITANWKNGYYAPKLETISSSQ